MNHLLIHFPLFLFCCFSTHIAQASSGTLEAGSEIYILHQKKSKTSNEWIDVLGLLVDVKSNQEDSSPQLIPYRFKLNIKEHKIKLFKNNLDDLLLARQTLDIEKSHYIKLYEPIKASKADREWLSFQQQNPTWDKHLYRGRRLRMTLINEEKPILASDVTQTCPHPPQLKSGKLCHAETASSLNSEIVKNIVNAAKTHSIPPEILASIIHMESKFNTNIENQIEKEDCLNKGDKCPTNRWGKGLSQLGAANSSIYGIDWRTKIERPQVCVTNQASLSCIKSLNQICLDRKQSCINKSLSSEKQNCHFKNDSYLAPWNCPEASIFAAAKKIAATQTLQPLLKVWQEDQTDSLSSKGVMKTVNFKNIWDRLPASEKARSYPAIYSRGPRYQNSWVEFFEQNKRWPQSYGELWSAQRLKASPSKAIGYQMLTHEFGNRCYVFKIAGLCGELPNSSLAAQYSQLFGGSQRKFSTSRHTQ